MLSVNFKKPTYELNLRADQSVAVANTRDERTKHQSKLLELTPAGAENWDQIVAVRGVVSSTDNYLTSSMATVTILICHRHT